MNNFTSHTQLELAEAIWRTLAYVDLFDYPLTAVEIHRYLDGVPASLDEVRHALRHSPLLAGQLLCGNGFYCLSGRETIFAIRQQRQEKAHRIDPSIGDGATERGRLNDNFKNAVEAAVADSKDKWETLKEQLILTYGPSRGTRMICALTRDKPKKSC